MKINETNDRNEDYKQDLHHYRTHIEVDKGILGKEIVPVNFPKDRTHRTYDPERYIRRHRLPAKVSGVIIDAALWVTGTTFLTSVFGRFLLNKALQDWRVGILLIFVLIIFPVFLSTYVSSKDADVKWAVGLKAISITLGSLIGGAHA